MKLNIIDKARQAGLILDRPMDAKTLRRVNPKLANRWADFIDANKAELVKEIAGRVCAS